MASGRLIDYLGHGDAADRPTAPDLHTGIFGLWWSDDTSELSLWDGTVWIEDIGGGGGGSVAWGSITGTLSAQTDLQAALDAKAANRDAVSALATSGSVAVDAALGDYFTLALAGNVSTFTFSNLPGSGHGCTLAIRITQDSTPRTVGWPASFKWAGGTPPAVSTASGAVDLLIITTFDNGTSWQADLAKAYA